jgi:hypothetical protein
MNVFYLDVDVKECARLHCDKHVVKMILECAQLLSSAHHVLESPMVDKVYKKTHVNHPSAVWVRESEAHYRYVYQLMLALGEEYTKRYHKTHLTITKMEEPLSHLPTNIPFKGWQDPPQCMPDEYKRDNTVIAYQLYYNFKADTWAADSKPMKWYGETND